MLSTNKIFSLAGLLLMGVFALVSVASVFAAAQDTTQISIEVSAACLVELKVYPEKRIPVGGNWANQNQVEFVNQAGVSQGVLTLESNSDGVGVFDICAEYPLTAGEYTVYVRGLSHLRKRFDNVVLNTSQPGVPLLDLTSGGRRLLAGETSVVFDNTINSLDISTQVKNMYTNDLKNDLNRDGVVNSLDISNTIHNFYKSGQ